MILLPKPCLFGLLCILLGACQAQTPPTTLSARLRKPAFQAPEKAIQDQLRIPFWKDNQYGLCNYAGKILLEPQFEDIEMPALDLPFLKAKKNGEWSMYDLSGKQILPFSVKMQHELDLALEFRTSAGHDYIYVAKLRDPRPASLPPLPKEPSGEAGNVVVEEAIQPEIAIRYFYFSKTTALPLQSWFAPDYRAYTAFTEKTRYHLSVFSNELYRGFIKVMDGNRRFTLLDARQQPLFEPVFNCAALSATKVLIQNEKGLVALRDLKTGWQTDFLFRNIQSTQNPDLFLGEVKEGDAILNYKIDAKGNISRLESEFTWLPIDERYSRVGVKSGEYSHKFYLLDEKTGKQVRELSTHRIEHIFETGLGIYQDRNLLGIETVAGDTIWNPPYPRITEIGDSLYIFFAGDTTGLATRDNRVLYRLVKGSITNWGDGYFEIEQHQKRGMLRADGHQILPLAFDKILPIRSARRLLVEKDGLWGMFDWETGREILPIEFRHLQPNGFAGRRRSGIEIRIGKDFFILSPDLEVLHQNTQTPVLTKQDFPLRKASAALKTDFEAAEMPRFFTPYTFFKGPNALHLFRCDGRHITSLEGYSELELMYSSNLRSNEEVGSAFDTGVAKLTRKDGQKVWVRLEDAFLYQK
ncbi:MAG: WG repeat-containing protein [Saprospiraceae bacterium]|nr:WG repeat-containing protein [Saprospiraceae bacterium]